MCEIDAQPITLGNSVKVPRLTEEQDGQCIQTELRNLAGSKLTGSSKKNSLGIFSDNEEAVTNSPSRSDPTPLEQTSPSQRFSSSPSSPSLQQQQQSLCTSLEYLTASATSSPAAGNAPSRISTHTSKPQYFSNVKPNSEQPSLNCEKSRDLSVDKTSPSVSATSSNPSSPSGEKPNCSRKRKVSSTLDSGLKISDLGFVESFSPERSDSSDSGTITLKTAPDTELETSPANCGRPSNGFVKGENGAGEEDKGSEGASLESSRMEDGLEEEQEERFNDDILCQHSKATVFTLFLSLILCDIIHYSISSLSYIYHSDG